MRISPREQTDKKPDTYLILGRLQIVMAFGLLFIVIYGLRYTFAPPHDVGILGVGILGAGAALVVGFLLGFIFCIPRTPNRNHTPTPPATPAAAGAAAPSSTPPDPDAQASPSVETNSNLVEISDWLTKIIVGVGLVELSKIPRKLTALAQYFGAGLRTCPSGTTLEGVACTASSSALALGIIIFFSSCGFVFGALWTRLYWQTSLNNLDRIKKKVGGTSAWVSIALSRLDTGLRTWRDPKPEQIENPSYEDSLKQLEDGLKTYPNDPDLHKEKSYVLGAYARSKLSKKEDGGTQMLERALAQAELAARLAPDDADAIYNVACYQAMLAKSIDKILPNLDAALKRNQELKAFAKTDPDLKTIWDNPKFQALTG